MAEEVCRISPVVFKRNGIKVEEVRSKLFDDIKKAIDDTDTSWELWAFTKTDEFKRKYGDKVEFDEIGEVTFPSLIKALDLKDIYDDEKSIEEVSRDYGFNNTVFDNSTTAINQINLFNSKEKKHVAVLYKVEEGYKVKVLPKTGRNIQDAKEQSYNHALTGEIIRLLQEMGFSVDFISDPKFNGMFNPEEATLMNGLLNVISIAKGERGEEALPEEFAHLIIEGLINHPLVKRLLDSLDEEQVKTVLGDAFEAYSNEYNGDVLKLKKEAAGQMLAQFILKKGTIHEDVMRPKASLLFRIWNWVKELFKKITNRHLDNARHNAEEAVAGIYNIVSSRDVVELIEKPSILRGSKLYSLEGKYDSLEKIAVEGETTVAKRLQWERGKPNNTKNIQETMSTLGTLQDLNDTEEHEIKAYESIYVFLDDAARQFNVVTGKMLEAKKDENNGWSGDIHLINKAAGIAREIDTLVMGYQGIIDAISNFDALDDAALAKMLNTTQISEKGLRELAQKAKGCGDTLRALTQWRHGTSRQILLWASRTVYKDDRVRGIGSKRNEVMSLEQIIEHAERDINVIDRWFSAMSDADDAYLTMFDGIVKNQQYERDMELIQINAEIAALDERLRKQGFSSDFIFERDKDNVPTGRLLSEYDWDAYNEEYKAHAEFLQKKQKEEGLSPKEYTKEMKRWKNGVDKKTGLYRLITVYVDPEAEKYHQEGHSEKEVEEKFNGAIKERVPNPKLFKGKANTINNLAPAQREYYDAMLNLKRRMMTRIPHRGQHLYNAIYISKDFVEGIVDNSTGNPVGATIDYMKRKFVRRPDDIGFGLDENFSETIKGILMDEKDSEKAANSIIVALENALDEDIRAIIPLKDIQKIIDKQDRLFNSKEINARDALKNKLEGIMDKIASENFYIVQTDFADHTIQKLPIYYSRPLRDMKMLSTDFSGAMVAYCAMAVNYEKMNEVVDILEVGRSYTKERAIRETSGNRSLMSKHTALGKVYKSVVEMAGNGTNTANRLDDYIDSVVYEERKNNEGSVDVLGVNIDIAKTLDTIKDYTGLLGLGFNIFSTLSNVTVGKLQQWIEAYGGEYFTVKNYAKACTQYAELMPGCLAEIASPVKKNKLSLLIQMFDPMGDYYEDLRNPNYNKSAVSRILGSGVLAYIGMNAGEHMLHCQTMLAILNNIQLIDMSSENKTKISLYDALEVVEENGITRLKLKDNLAFERELIDQRKNPTANKNYGKPLKDENGKIKTELVRISDTTEARNLARDSKNTEKDNPNVKAYNEFTRFIIKKKRIIRKVNDTLNGAFSANDKGAIHRKALGRLALQFRQWMPAHYARRFARAHYDNDLEQWKEGYYVTVVKTLNQMRKELRKSGFAALSMYKNLSEHEQANLRRANAEIAEFLILMVLIRIGGRVKDRDRSWLDKMGLYQLRRAYLEVGASMPLNGGFFSNIITILQSPAAAIDTFEKFSKVLQFWNIMDEIETGRYEGWSELERDIFEFFPALPQLYKSYYFDESMFTILERGY